jgi:hypothetical protein
MVARVDGGGTGPGGEDGREEIVGRPSDCQSARVWLPIATCMCAYFLEWELEPAICCL